MLDSLRKLDASEIQWELVFVDNGSSDGTAQILDEFGKYFRVPVQLIYEPTRGLSAARNTGWRAARGQIICFTDDDCYPSPDWLLCINHAFSLPNTDYIGGRVLLFDPNDAPVTIQPSEEVLSIPARSHIESGCIIGANLSCRKIVLEATKGFDSRLGAGTSFYSGEDTDFLTRASMLGFEGRYEPSITVYHHHRRRLEIEIQKLYIGYAYGRGAVSMKAILESNAWRIYLKHWYWRLRSLAKQKKTGYCITEFKGALHFLAVKVLWKLFRGKNASPVTARVTRQNFDAGLNAFEKPTETFEKPPSFIFSVEKENDLQQSGG
jgi:hypothetical protein